MNYRRSHLFKGTINKKYISREFLESLCWRRIRSQGKPADFRNIVNSLSIAVLKQVSRTRVIVFYLSFTRSPLGMYIYRILQFLNLVIII